MNDPVEHKIPASHMALKYFLALFLISGLLLGLIFWPFLSILVLSFLLAGIFQPVYSWLSRWLPPVLASVFTCFLIVVLVFLPLFFFVGALSREAFSLYQLGKDANLAMKLKDFLDQNIILLRLQEILASYGMAPKPEEVSVAVSDLIRSVGFFLYEKASSWAANVVTFLFSFFMMILTIFFLLIDRERLIAFLLDLLPLPDQQGRKLFTSFEEISGAVLIGNGICGLIQGVLGGILFAVFDFGPPILWGFVMGILAFLPILGIGIVLLPLSAIMLLQGRIDHAIVAFAFYVVVSFPAEYGLKPKLVGDRVKMHTLLVFLSIMGGLAVFGVLGIIYGPLISTAFLAMSELYIANYGQYLKDHDMASAARDTEY